MANTKKLIQAAAGLGGEALNVEEVFSTYLYTGNSTSTTTQQITNGIDLAGEGGLVWTKSRTSGTYTSFGHGLMDTERGIDKILKSQATDAETTISDWAVSFNSDGFTLDGSGYVNENTVDYASWTFRKAPKFFDVVTYTGDGVSGRTISHNLGCEVGCIITKRLNSSVNNWSVYHRKANPTAPQNVYLTLNNNDGAAGNTAYWNDTAPTDTVFTVGNGNTNFSGNDYVAYLFAHNDGDGGFGPDGDADIIKCGSYTGNGSTDGPEIDLGFEPQWLLIKDVTTGNTAWSIWDNMRGVATGSNDAYLQPHATSTEASYNGFAFTSTGFKVENTAGFINSSGDTYIYIAIRRGPMAVPEDATDVFAIDQGDGSSTDPQWVSNFPVDMGIWKRTSGSNSGVGARLLQGRGLFANLTQAENAQSLWQFDHQDGWYDAALDTSYYSWMWRRAPSFFDVVAYTTPTQTDTTVYHNLGVVPELAIVKRRDSTGSWFVTIPNDGTLLLNDTAAKSTTLRFTNATDTQFTAATGGSFSHAETNADWIAYLFASLDGVSKVGSYTGNGSTQNIDCGFSSGARFVLLKKTSGTGHWLLFDSERGIVSGNDPFLELNRTTAEKTTFDIIDPYSNGFTLTNDTTYGFNASGETFIFYAIA